MFKQAICAAAGALALFAATMPTDASAEPAHRPVHHAVTMHRPMQNKGVRQMRPAPRQVAHFGRPALHRVIVRGGRPEINRIVVRGGRTTFVNRVIVRDGRRVVVGRPHRVFLGGRIGPAFVGGGAPSTGCSVRRDVFPTPFGLRKIVTVRTCFVP